MMSPQCERAVEDATRYGRALLKFISPNDAGLTATHQAGFYLPKAVAQAFTPQPPEKDVNHDHPVTILWQDGQLSESVVKWYGRGTRSEYRITRFGNDFPWRTPDNVGDLLVLIPRTINEFNAYVLDLEEDIDEIQAALGVEVLESWTFYERDAAPAETEDVCLNRTFRAFAAAVEAFPEGRIFSDTIQTAIRDCVASFADLTADQQLIRLIDEEFTLFRMVERKIFEPRVRQLFASIDDFLDTARSIQQARMSRSGRSLENHVEYLLRQAGLPYEMRQLVDKTRPDILIPGKVQYLDPAFPIERLFVIGVKRTCKDRWRQVIQEAPRIPQKHILTLQEGISGAQLDEMHQAGVILIVPEVLHRAYPPDHTAVILGVQAFIASVRALYAAP